jgi:hypothetical protein
VQFFNLQAWSIETVEGERAGNAIRLRVATRIRAVQGMQLELPSTLKAALIDCTGV